MKIPIIKIGNSKGIRIPKSILEQCNFDDLVEITVKNNTLIISSSKNPRKGWNEAFKKMAKAGDDKLLDIAEIPLEFDKDWEW